MAKKWDGTFHEEGYSFVWNPQTKKVFRNNGLVATNCYNMEAARREARNYLRQVRADAARRKNYGL